MLSTEAAASLGLMISKAVTFQQMGALPWPQFLQGLIVGASMMAGSFLGKQVVDRISLHTFEFMLDIMLVISGLSIIWTGLG